MIIPELRTQRPSNKRGPPSAQKQGTNESELPNISTNNISQTRPSIADMPRQIHSQPGGPILKELQAWQFWPELTVKVSNLPSDVTTWHLWKEFAKQGNVVYIEIFESRQEYPERAAKIRFSPVPHHDFWSSGPVLIKTMDGHGEFNTNVTADYRKRPSWQIQSPIRKMIWYPKIMSLSLSGIGFGLMYDEATMMNMRQTQCIDRKELTFNVDFARRRITAKFQLDFAGLETDMQPPKPIANISGIRDQVQSYMFQIPFSQLEKIYRVEVTETCSALIVTINSPPQFYRKRPPGPASHVENALVWSEFDTYLRQTDIVFDREHLKTSSIALNKEMATIDIGNTVLTH